MTKLMAQVWNKLDIPAGTKVRAEHVVHLPGTLCMAVAHIQCGGVKLSGNVAQKREALIQLLSN